MEIAVLSDIHGNFEAFQACMDYALARNIHTFLFLGDYLGEILCESPDLPALCY